MIKTPWKTLVSLVALSLFACTSKRSSASRGDGSDSPAAEAASSGASVDASWSATIDGASVTGRGVDELQQENSAYVLPRAGAGNKHLMFILYSTATAGDTKANNSLNVHVPPHAGTYVHAGTYESCTCSITLDKNISEGSLARYLADTVTITISSMSATRISGTFSGNFKLSVDTPRATQKRAVVTNGKFDIPMSTSSITPE